MTQIQEVGEELKEEVEKEEEKDREESKNIVISRNIVASVNRLQSVWPIMLRFRLRVGMSHHKLVTQTPPCG